MSSKKGSKRAEDTSPKTGKKKLKIDGDESGSEEFYVPQGFARMGLAEWAEGERRRILRSGAPNTQDTGSSKLDELEHDLAKAKCDRSNQGTRQAATRLRGNARFGSLHHCSGNYPEENEHTISEDGKTNKSSDVKEQVPVVQPNTEDEGRAHSISLTEIARAGGCESDEDEVEGPALVTVGGCRLKEEFAPTARNIEKKHGDILTGCTFEGIQRSNLVENVCTIYKRLEKVEFDDIKMAEVESMKKDVRDLLKANVDVGWLANRLDEIHHAKVTLLAAPGMKEHRTKKQERILELEKEVQAFQKKVHELQKELESEKEEAAKIRRAHFQAKYEVMRFYKKSLVKGI